MRASRTIAIGLITICAVTIQLRAGHDQEGVAVSKEQASRVFGGDSSVHYYQLAGSVGFCSVGSYKGCEGSNTCTQTTSAASLCGNGTKCYIPNQPCSMKVCEGGNFVSCGNVTITGCNGGGTSE